MALYVPHAIGDGSDRTTTISRGIIRRLIKPQGQCGKLRYMSPEIFVNREPFDGYAIDMWTCGTILFFMLTGSAYQQVRGKRYGFFMN
jgi:serine/threonine protein kinase